MGWSRPYRALQGRSARLAGISLVAVVLVIAGGYALLPLAIEGLTSAVDLTLQAGLWLATLLRRGRRFVHDCHRDRAGGVPRARLDSRARYHRRARAARALARYTGCSGCWVLKGVNARLTCASSGWFCGLHVAASVLLMHTGAEAAQADTSHNADLARQVDRRFSVLPITDGIVLTPKTQVVGVRSIELASGTISVDARP